MANRIYASLILLMIVFLAGFAQPKIDGEGLWPSGILSDTDMDSINIELFFDPSTITEIGYGGLSYITADGFFIPFEEGDAALPFSNEMILVHPFATEIHIEIETITSLPYSPTSEVAGVLRSVPYSIPEKVLPERPKRYPENHISIVKDGYIRGLRIMDIRFDPIIMTEEGLTVATELRARLTFNIEDHSEDDIQIPYKRSTSIFKKDLTKKIMNSDDLKRYPAIRSYIPMKKLTNDDVQYVIITNTSLVGDGFDDLVRWKNSKGVPTRLVEMSFIDDNYPGIDMAERMRNFIKDAVSTWDIEFVLLGGDVNVVPYRGAFARTSTAQQTSNACDLYFSDLDGTWNADNDSYWGETSDGCDLRPDVYVGRASVQNPQEVLTFVDKTLKYEMDPPSGYLDNATFAGEYLDDYTNSSRGMDLIKNNLIPSNNNVTSLYDSGKGDPGNLNRQNFMSQVDNGASLIYHAGHCNWNVMSVGTAQSGSLYNSHVSGYHSESKYGILNTVGCIANRFNSDDSIVEKHVQEPDGGMVAAIGNSHYGWYAYGYPGFGPSEQFMYQMTKEIFEEEIVTIGGHFAEGKNYFVSNSNSYNSARWLQIVLNLIGDPEATIRTSEPVEINVTMPNTTGKEFKGFPVKVSSHNGTPLEGALVCLQKSDYYRYALTNDTGMVSFDFYTQTLDQLNVTITAYNHRPFIANLSLDLVLPSIKMNGALKGTTGDDFTLNTTVMDESGIDTVYFYTEHDNRSYEMEKIGKWWYGRITLPHNSTDEYSFRISAFDCSGNNNLTGWMGIEVEDNDIPVMLEDRTHFNAYTGDPFEFSGIFDDNIKVHSVIVEHWSDSEEIIETTLSEIKGIWRGSYLTRTDITGIRNYRFKVADLQGNLLVSPSSTYLVEDNDRPYMIMDLSDTEATTSDPFFIRAKVRDNIAIGSVHLEWWMDGQEIRYNESMYKINDTWIIEMKGDASDLSSIHYIIRFVDINGNWNSTKISTIMMRDNDPPALWDDMSDREALTGSVLSFSIKARDNVELDDVSVIYEMEGIGSNEIKLQRGIDDIWEVSVKIPTDWAGRITYGFRATDKSGLINNTENKTIVAGDMIPPSIDEIICPTSVPAGKIVNISVRGADNIGIEEVIMTWWFGGEEPSRLGMTSSGDVYNSQINVPLNAYGNLYILISIIDFHGNREESERKGILVIEHIEPEVEEKPRIPLSGEDFDNDGMDDRWEYLNNLDYSIDDSALDPDNDGYSNLEEFTHGTDPNDPESRPAFREEDDQTSFKGVVTVLVLLFAFIGAAVLLVISIRGGQNFDQDIPKENASTKSKGHKNFEIFDPDDHRPRKHSFKLNDDGIRHPHSHPTHTDHERASR